MGTPFFARRRTHHRIVGLSYGHTELALGSEILVAVSPMGGHKEAVRTTQQGQDIHQEARQVRGTRKGVPLPASDMPPTPPPPMLGTGGSTRTKVSAYAQGIPPKGDVSQSTPSELTVGGQALSLPCLSSSS